MNIKDHTNLLTLVSFKNNAASRKRKDAVQHNQMICKVNENCSHIFLTNITMAFQCVLSVNEARRFYDQFKAKVKTLWRILGMRDRLQTTKKEK